MKPINSRKLIRRWDTYSKNKRHVLSSPAISLLVALLGSVSIASGEESNNTTDTMKHLWARSTAKLVSPAQGDYQLSCQGGDQIGNFLFRADSAQGPLFVVVDSKTGKPLKQIATSPNPKQTLEWTAQSRFLPDGLFLHVGVRRGLLEDEKEYPQGKVQVGVNIRVINTVTAGIVERLIPFDDPTGNGLSKGPCSWTGQVCVNAKAWQSKIYLSNKHFIAELNADSLQTERFVMFPEIYRPAKGLVMDELGPLQHGCVWFVQDGKTGEEGWKFILGELGKEPREISRAEYRRMAEDFKIEEVAHPKTKQVEFLARENGFQKELIQRNGSILTITYQPTKTMNVDLGAANAETKAVIERCGNYYFIYVSLDEGNGRMRQKGVIVVAEPKAEHAMGGNGG